MTKVNNKEHIGIRESDITTVLEKDVEFKGHLTFKTSFMIKGKFEGEIESEGLLLIGKNAIIKAKIKINTLISYGQVTGNVIANRHIILCGGSSLKGDIESPNITIENNSLFNGFSKMLIPAEK